MSGNTKVILNAVAGNTYDFSEEVDKKLKEKVGKAIKDEETKVDMDEEKDDNEESPLEESAGQILRMLQGMRKTTKDIDRMLTRAIPEKKERMEITNQLWQLRNELGLVEESLDEGEPAKGASGSKKSAQAARFGALRRESVEYFEEKTNRVVKTKGELDNALRGISNGERIIIMHDEGRSNVAWIITYKDSKDWADGEKWNKRIPVNADLPG